MLQIRAADLDAPELAIFLREHLADLAPTAPACSQHALDLDGLRAPGVRLWSAHDGPHLVGTVALAPVEPGHEELKSMRADPLRRGQGIGRALLEHALADATARGVTRVSLETGSMEFFAPARALYARAGFVDCAPFGDYAPDSNSAFMTRSLP
ncbi:GNAT family N-acetyltransferase [Barrientosiimonas humi]|uniref:GNAT family N-acetyltransferase n=1 Tax=Barrientosiimonas humi TaxID=999931 RepID=UPI00370D2627